VDIPSVFRLINTGVPILVGEIGIFGVQPVDEFEIGSVCHESSMTVLKVSATPGILTTKIGSWANTSAGCP